MLVFRIENVKSGLGPFAHGRQAVLKNKGIKISVKYFPDICDETALCLINKHGERALFGFSTLCGCNSVIRDRGIFKKLGFRIRVYNVEPLLLHESGHLIFLKPSDKHTVNPVLM